MPVKDTPTSSGILAILYPHCSPDETSGLPAPPMLTNTPTGNLAATISKPDLTSTTDSFVGDTESRSNIKDSDIAYRVCPRAFVQVNPCRREGVGVYLRLHQAERPLVVRGCIGDAYGRVSRNRIEFLSELQHSLRGYAGFRACVFYLLEQRAGYGILIAKVRC